MQTHYFEKEVCVSIPTTQQETLPFTINTDTHMVYSYKNLTRLATIMNMILGELCRSVDDNFEVFVRQFRDPSVVKRVFLNNFESIFSQYVKAKFPNIKSLFAAQTSEPINDNFPAHMWIENGITFFVYNTEKITELVGRAFSLMVLSHYDYKSGEMKLAAYEQLSVQSKYNLEIEKTISRLTESDTKRCVNNIQFRRFVTDPYESYTESLEDKDQQLHKNISSIWETKNTATLSMLIILTEIIETPILEAFEDLIENFKVPKPIIHINFAEQKIDEINFLPSRLASKKDVSNT